MGFAEIFHVLKEVGASLESDEKFRLLAVASVVRRLNCDGLGSDLLESGVVVPIFTSDRLASAKEGQTCATCQTRPDFKWVTSSAPERVVSQSALRKSEFTTRLLSRAGGKQRRAYWGRASSAGKTLGKRVSTRQK